MIEIKRFDGNQNVSVIVVNGVEVAHVTEVRDGSVIVNPRVKEMRPEGSTVVSSGFEEAPGFIYRPPARPFSLELTPDQERALKGVLRTHDTLSGLYLTPIEPD